MGFLQRLSTIFRKRSLDADLDDELRSHIELRTEDLIKSGVPADEARRQAMLAFGNRALAKEDARSFDTVRWLETLLQDVRYSVRQLRRSPGFAVAAIVTLAVGIGTTTLMFSVVNTVLLRPLPFPHSQRLVSVAPVAREGGAVSVESASYPDFFDWRDRSQSFAALSSIYQDSFTMTGAGEPAHVATVVVAADFLKVLGTEPSHGRGFTQADEKPGANVVLLSDRAWRRYFHADASVVGTAVRLGKQEFTVIGVMPAGFQYPIGADTDFWMSLSVAASGPTPATSQRGFHYLDVIGRLKPGVTAERAQSEMSLIAAALSQQYPDSNARLSTVRVVPQLKQLTEEARPGLIVLLAGVCCLLLIACANVANLLLAKGTARTSEIAVRFALGARPGRIVRQLITESTALWLLGGGAGLATAYAARRLIVSLAEHQVPRIANLAIEGRVVLAALAVSLLTGIVFGLTAAAPLLKSGFDSRLRAGGRSGMQSAGAERVRRILVAAEVAVVLVLLFAAALLGNSYWRLQHVDAGFRTHGVLSFSALMSGRFSNPADPADRFPRTLFYGRLLPKLRAIPGVDGAAAALPLPLSNNDLSPAFHIEGRPNRPGFNPSCTLFTVTPGYFETMAIPLSSGRVFTERDDYQARAVALISETFARKYFPGEDPIGKRIEPHIGSGNSGRRMREIVGVVGDVKLAAPAEEPAPQMYVPYDQLPLGSLPIVLHARVEPESLLPQITAALHEVDPESPLYNARTMEELMDRALAGTRFNMVLLLFFAGAALLLTTVGLYGVIAYAVARRTREFGVRLALGASPGEISRIVLRSGARLALIGAGVGVAGAIALARLLAGLLYGVRPLDPLTLGGVTLLVAGIALAAAYVPARRASRVDPMAALRYE